MQMRRAWPGFLLLAIGCSSAPPPATHGWPYDFPIEDVRRKPPPDARFIGTAHPYTIEAVTPRFIILCQAREDTNHNGAISVRVEMHGDTGGDELVPYLILSDGPGERLDVLVDT